MSNGLYSLEVVSRHPEFSGKSLKKYSVDGIETVGAWGNEPFEVVFKNNTWNKVQVKLSIDGTDILTGKPADTEVNGDMWVVNGYGTLKLKAWPETNKGGAQFIFTSAEKSVAVNTHGDLSSRSIIAAAVYTESYVAPVSFYNSIYDWSGATRIGGNFGGFNDYLSSDGITAGNCSLGDQAFGCSLNDGLELHTSTVSASAAATPDSRRLKKSMQSLAAVGAGQHIQQNIQQTTGLIKPALGEIVRVRYMWWTELKEACQAAGIQPIGSGFPGEEKRMMSIGNTPRIGSWSPPPITQSVYSRF